MSSSWDAWCGRRAETCLRAPRLGPCGTPETSTNTAATEAFYDVIAVRPNFFLGLLRPPETYSGIQRAVQDVFQTADATRTHLVRVRTHHAQQCTSRAQVSSIYIYIYIYVHSFSNNRRLGKEAGVVARKVFPPLPKNVMHLSRNASTVVNC